MNWTEWNTLILRGCRRLLLAYFFRADILCILALLRGLIQLFKSISRFKVIFKCILIFQYWVLLLCRKMPGKNWWQFASYTFRNTWTAESFYGLILQDILYNPRLYSGSLVPVKHRGLRRPPLEWICFKPTPEMLNQKPRNYLPGVVNQLYASIIY